VQRVIRMSAGCSVIQSALRPLKWQMCCLSIKYPITNKEYPRIEPLHPSFRKRDYGVTCSSMPSQSSSKGYALINWGSAFPGFFLPLYIFITDGVSATSQTLLACTELAEVACRMGAFTHCRTRALQNFSCYSLNSCHKKQETEPIVSISC